MIERFFKKYLFKNACKYQKIKTLNYLLNNFFDINFKNKKEETALKIASKTNKIKTIE